MPANARVVLAAQARYRCDGSATLLAAWALATALGAVWPVRADLVAPVADRPAPHGVLDLGNEGFATGRLVPAPPAAEGRDTLLWEAPLFAAPLEVRLEAIRSIRFAPQPAGAPAPRRIHLRGGDVISGTVAALDAELLTLVTSAPAGTRLTVRRDEIESVARPGAGGASFDGPGGLVGWRQSPPGTWRDEAGRLLGGIPGTSVSRDVAAPPRCRFDVVLSWRVRPEFRVAFGPIDDEGPDRFWIEAVDVGGRPTLMLVRREADRARVQPLDIDLADVDRIRLVVFVDRAAGRMAVMVPTVAAAPLADVRLPPAADRQPAGGFRLALGAGDVCLERLQVTPWQTDEPTLEEARGGTVVTSRDRLGEVEIEGFEAAGATASAAGTWRLRRGGETLSVPDEDVLELRFPAGAAAPQEEPALRVVLANGDRVSGRLHAVDDGTIVLVRRGIAEPLPLPFAGIAVVQTSRVAAPPDLPGRVGTLTAAGLSLRGCLVGLPDGDEAAARGAAWQPSCAVRAAGFRAAPGVALAATVEYVAPGAQLADGEEWVGGIGGLVNQDAEGRMTVTMLTEDGAAARDGRLLPGDRITAVRCAPQSPFVATAGLDTETVMNLLRGRVGTPVVLRVATADGEAREIDLVRGPIGVVGREVLEMALSTHARYAVVEAEEGADVYPAVAFLRDGDVVRCRVERIDAAGARVATAVSADPAAALDVPADRLQAIELVPAAASRVLDAVRVERLLTVPRMQRDRPPTHLLRLLDGDYLRGRLEQLDDAIARIEVLATVRDVPRSAVARVIWLHDGDPLATTPVDGGGVPMRAEWGDGRRLRLAATGVTAGELRGQTDALGAVRVELDAIDRLRLGAGADEPPVDRPYARWRLRPAQLPRALRDEKPVER
jgi:hypothetical protein